MQDWVFRLGSNRNLMYKCKFFMVELRPFIYSLKVRWCQSTARHCVSQYYLRRLFWFTRTGEKKNPSNWSFKFFLPRWCTGRERNRSDQENFSLSTIVLRLSIWWLGFRLFWMEDRQDPVAKKNQNKSSNNRVQVILFEIDCGIFLHKCTWIVLSVHKLNKLVNPGKFKDNCWISCQVMADMKKVYNNLIIINL